MWAARRGVPGSFWSLAGLVVAQLAAGSGGMVGVWWLGVVLAAGFK